MENLPAGGATGLIIAMILAALALLGRRYESSEQRAISALDSAIDTLTEENARLRVLLATAEAALAEEIRARRAAEDVARQSREGP